MKLSIMHYFKCQLKSTDKCPKFYTPKLNINTTDADGGVLVQFGDDSGDTRIKPDPIIIPAATVERCPPMAYVNFNNDAVADGAPRLLTEEQYSKASASLTPDTASEMDDYQNNEHQGIGSGKA